jgi:pyruvate-formate lyase-activating enzyme
MNSTVILYGAGGHAQECIDRWLAEGLNPVCFVDADAQKHNKTLGGLGILPLSAAIERYPDYVLRLTQTYENLPGVTEDLLRSGIPRCRIGYADPFEWRKGCGQMGRHIGLAYDTFHICCHDTFYQRVARTENIDSVVGEAKKYVAELIDDLRKGRSTSCDQCPALREGIWDKEPKLWRVGISSDFDATPCDFKCVYCVDGVRCSRAVDKSITPLEVIKKVHAAIKDDAVILGLAAGEITVAPWGDAALDFIREKCWYTQLSTNASVYNEKIAALLRDGIIEVNVSLDAGTRETFARVKGRDCWNAVKDNAGKYAAARGKFHLKYIMLEGINDNKADMDGFLELCGKLKVGAILSANTLALKPLTRAMLDSYLYFAKRAVKKNISVTLLEEYLFPEDREQIKKALCF